MNVDVKQAYWDKIYQEKDPMEVSWYQNEPDVSLNFITKLTGKTKEAQIIDVGGGASVLIDYLLNLGFSNVAVLDISLNAINYSKDRLSERASMVEWYVSDVTEFSSLHLYDIWHDRAVFHFLLEPSQRAKYVKTLKNTLRKGGYAIIATFAKDGPKKCSGLDIVQYDSTSIQSELGDSFKLLNQQSEIHITPNGSEQHFNYFLFQLV